MGASPAHDFRIKDVAISQYGTKGIQPTWMPPRAGPFRPLQGPEALLYAAASEPSVRLFLGSSAVEHSTVNRMVAGSNPARGAN
jgi:hypothetical protein